MSKNSNYKSKNWQKIILIGLGGTLGVLLLIFGGGFGDTDKDAVTDTEVDYREKAQSYADVLEERIARLCSEVRGAGETEVFVSLKGGYRTVYAVDSQSTSSGYKNQLVMSGSGASEEAVVTAVENPEIAGVGIVCEGGGDPNVRSELISLVSAALNISTNKIFVAQASDG